MAREEFNFLIPKPFRDDPLFLYIHPRKADDKGLVPDGSLSAPYRTINDAMTQVNSNRFVYNSIKFTSVVLYLLPGLHILDRTQIISHPDISQQSNITITLNGISQPDDYDYCDPGVSNESINNNDHPTLKFIDSSYTSTKTLLQIKCHCYLNGSITLFMDPLYGAAIRPSAIYYGIQCQNATLEMTKCKNFEVLNFPVGIQLNNSMYNDYVDTSRTDSSFIRKFYNENSAYKTAFGSVMFSIANNSRAAIGCGHYQATNWANGFGMDGESVLNILPAQLGYDYTKQAYMFQSIYLEFNNISRVFSFKNNCNIRTVYIDKNITTSAGMINKLVYANYGHPNTTFTNTDAGNIFYDGTDKYVKTTDTSLTDGKTYYTKSGASYVAVTSPIVSQISTYYEDIRDRATIIKSIGCDYFSISDDVIDKYDRTDPTTQSTTGGFIL